MPKVFIHPKEAINYIEDPHTIFVDCRHDLTDPNYGRRAYQEGHIVGAVFAHLDENLSGTISDETGRHPLPDASKFMKWLSNNGFTQDQTIIAYCNFSGGISARFWWMLTQLGFENVHILIGGYDLWITKKYPIDRKVPLYKKTDLETDNVSWDNGPYEIKTIKDLANNLQEYILFDCRSPERYRGDEEPYDPIPGRIPGAKNVYWKYNLKENLDILDKEKVKANFVSLLDENAINSATVYCGSGVTACFNLAILEHYDLGRPNYYPGSYSEWVRNQPDLIELGD